MKFDELTKDNWVMFAIKHYNNTTSVTYEDFLEDLNTFKYIKRLLKRYETDGELKVSLILNHVIILYNIFDDAATPLLFFKIETKYWPVLKAFMLFLNRLPETINSKVDQECLNILNLI
jgi:hypothetical protein